MKRDVFVDFMGISTYGKGKTTSGEVKVTKDLDISLEGANVLIVEDIVDSVSPQLPDARAGAAQAPLHPHRALLDKPDRRLRPIHAHYVGSGFPTSSCGYGLDYAEKYRNLDIFACWMGAGGEITVARTSCPEGLL